MSLVKNQIIPSKPSFIGKENVLDKKAICVFAAIGFFLDDDTYFQELKVLKPTHEYQIESDKVTSKKAYFKWHYTPIDRPFEQIVDEFAELFETIIKEQVNGKKVILPLSGGLDSRTQAAALYHLKIPVSSYSYEFLNGHKETYYSEKIAKACNFSFVKWQVKDYLWEAIEKLATINGCYAEFTHPRQMAFVNEYASMGDVFSLGHWGDVLFDDMGVPDEMCFDDQVNILLKKIVKKGGMELANSLWQTWGLEGDFKIYLKQRIANLLGKINIPQNANAQIRAFKSMYWAPRWTSANLSIFESVRPISLPYYDNRMCEFICSIPECYLSGRQIQIAYLKKRMPELAKIRWQDHRPFNLYNYHWNKRPWNIPYKVYNKLSRMLKREVVIQRNWELQFLGTKNEGFLKKYLFESEAFSRLIPKEIVQDFYQKFSKENSVYYSHSVSMLLTLSLFTKIHWNEKY